MNNIFMTLKKRKLATSVFLFVFTCFDSHVPSFLNKISYFSISTNVVKSMLLQESERRSFEQCQLVIDKLESSTLGYLFQNNRDICKLESGNNKKSWRKKLVKSAQPPYLEFFNEIYPSEINIKMDYLSKNNRTAMLLGMGSGEDYSKCFILGFSGYGNRGIWSAAAAKGLASQFYDNKVPLRWDIVAGISSGGFNAILSSHFIPGGVDLEKNNHQHSNEFLFKDTNSRSDSYICSNVDKDIKFEFWFKLDNSNKSNIKCYSPNSSGINISNFYSIGNNSIENELSYTNFLYEIYMNGNSEVINDNCFVPTSQDSTKWWSTILLTFANLGKKSVSSFCNMNGWKKFYKDAILKYVNRKREAIVSASRLFDGTLINWSIQYIESQILSEEPANRDIQKDNRFQWVEIKEEHASKLADIATASNAVSGVYMPIKINNEYFVWGGMRGESNLEAAIERCKEIKPGIKEEDIVIDFITGSYYREEIFLAGSYVELLGKENYFGKLFRRFQNYIHRTSAYARPDPPQLFELLNRAWEFITASSRGMYPIKSILRRYPKVKVRFFIRPKTLKFFPKSSYFFPNHRDKILIMTDGYYTGYNATIIDVKSVEIKNSV